MKKISKLGICAMMFAFSASMVFADGMVFEPVDMPAIESATEAATKVPDALPAETKTIANSAAAKTSSSGAAANNSSFFEKFSANSQPKIVDMSLKENQDMQSALVNLDTSQVELRQNLQTLETKYAQVDAEYQKYKTERKELNKEIKVVNKKLKNIESVKTKIRKNML